MKTKKMTKKLPFKSSTLKLNPLTLNLIKL